MDGHGLWAAEIETGLGRTLRSGDGDRAWDPPSERRLCFLFRANSVTGLRRILVSRDRIDDGQRLCAAATFPGVDKSKKSDLLCWRFRQRQFRKISGATATQENMRNLTILCALLTASARKYGMDQPSARSIRAEDGWRARGGCLVHGSITGGEQNAARTRSTQFQPA